VFRFRQAAGLLGVSDDTIRRWADAGRLPTAVDVAGRRGVEGTVLARFAQEISAPPLGSSEMRIIGQSARNRFIGLVTRVTCDSVMAQVDIQAGPFRVVSLLSREAVEELGLAPGSLAVASIKSTNVVVEVPDVTMR
jgi:molybdopterin-binding protein